MLKILTIVIIMQLFFGLYLYADDIELVIYKDFLQDIVNKVFPLVFKDKFVPNIQLSERSDPLEFEYEIIVNKPVITIETEFIQLDTTVTWISILGKQSSPGKIKLRPEFNKEDKCMRFEVIEGKVRLKTDLNNSMLDLGEIDVSKYMSDIKIPLKLNDIKVNNKNISAVFEKVDFTLLNDRILAKADVSLNNNQEGGETAPNDEHKD